LSWGFFSLARAGPAPAADGEVHLELGLVLEGGDVSLGVEDLHTGGQVDVLGGDLTGAGDHERGLDFARVGVHPAHDPLEVEDDVGHILLDTPNGRELVRDALDADAGDGGAGERGEQHPAQRVAKGVTEAPVERLDGERATVVVDTL
jgi:hypothetical protein